MAKKEKRRPWIRWIIMALALATFSYFVWGQISIFRLMAMRNEKQGLRRHIDSLTTLVDELEAQKKRLLTDSVYLEKLARRETGMAKPHEKVYRFVAPAAR